MAQAMTRRNWLVAVVLVIAGLVGVDAFGLELAHRYLRKAQERADRLHATILVCQVVRDFLERDGYKAWPRSWDDLRSVPDREWGHFKWPRDAERVVQLVDVDFGARLEDVAKQDERTWHTIVPRGPEGRMYFILGVRPLLEDVRNHTKARDNQGDAGPG
jgi:hypothetical protein